jgi:hypothetical protein
MARGITRALTFLLHQQLVKSSLALQSAALAALVSRASLIRADSCGSLFLFLKVSAQISRTYEFTG